MANPNIGPTVILQIDGTGTSETRPCAFPFANDPLIKAGDTLSSALPNISWKNPPGQGAPTFGTPTLSGTTWTLDVSVANGNPNATYRVMCTAQTNGGYTIECEIEIVLEGIGFSPQGSPSPSLGGLTGTYTSTTGVPQSLTFANGFARNTVILGPVTSAQMQATGITAGVQGDASHIPVFNIDAAGRATSFTNTPMVVQDKGGQVFNVLAYGAKGDNVTDDTAAIQAAHNAAMAVGGIVEFPPPPGGWYRINSGLSITAISPSQQTVIWRGTLQSHNHGINLNYTGPSNTSVVSILGCQDCQFENIGIQVVSSVSNVVVWDVQFTAAVPNASYNHWKKSNVFFQNVKNCIAWRLGQDVNGGGASNGYSTAWTDCNALDVTNSSGNIGWQIGGSQNFSPQFYKCGYNTSCGVLTGPIGSYLAAGALSTDTVLNVADTLLFPPSGTVVVGSTTLNYTSKSVQSGPGQLVLSGQVGGAGIGILSAVELSINGTVYTGNTTFTWIGGGASAASMGYDFLLNANGYARIMGGQWQMNQNFRRFLQYGYGGSGALTHITVENCQLAGFNPPTDGNGVIWLHANASLRMVDCNFNQNSAPYSATGNNYLISTNNTSTFGAVRLEHSDVYGTFPFNLNQNNWRFTYANTQLTNSGGGIASVLDTTKNTFRTISSATYTALTSDYTIMANAASNAITLNLPAASSVPPGFPYIIKKIDSSANAVTVTPAGTNKIDTASTYGLATINKFVSIESDGSSNWYVVGSN